MKKLIFSLASICAKTNGFGSEEEEEESSAILATLSISSDVHFSRKPPSISRAKVALHAEVH